jgi:hypothetical protein
VRVFSTLIPLKSRSIGSDRISKLLAAALVVGLLSSVGSIAPAQAIVIGSGICSSDAGSNSGVVVASSGGYCYVAFTNSGTNSWTAPSGVNSADFLIIAGGGAGGGGAWGGGGGAGEVVHYTNYSVSSSSALNLNIGSGGTPGTATLDPTLNRSNPGGNSWIASSSGVVAQGGGAGASYAYNSASQYSVGQNGGSGGAGTENIASSSPSINNLGGTSTKTTSGSRTGYGNNGGRGGPSASTQSGGGGGGAGGVGADAGTAVGGNGGNGTNVFSAWLSAINSGMSAITGWQTATSSGFIAGGGGGGTTTTRGAGGSGGGGRGGSNSDFFNGESAIANTGSGGGGSGYGGSSKIGGTGGSGLIIVRYADTTAPTYSSSSISSDGLSLTLTYSESLSATTATPANFVVTLNSTETRTVSSVSISGSSALLALGTRIESGQSIAVTYTDPTGGNDANAIQDLWGNDAITFSNQSITNTLNSTNDSAISLNGSSQYLSAAGTQVIPTSTSATFTVEAWIFPANNSVSNSVIISQGPNGGRFYLKRSSDGVVRFFREGHSAESSCGAVPIQEWTHVAVVIGNSASKCYINGGLVLSNSFTSSTSIGTGFMVGQYTLDPSNAAYYFAGQIDEVKIWSTDRSSSISDDLKTYGGTLANGLVAYYDFNELVGTRVVNRSTGGSSALDLTSTGTPTITSNSIIETSSVQAYTVVKFMRSFLVAAGGWKTPANRQLRVFAVGGGGGGGFNSGGGGSGGGYLATNYSANLETVSVIVGVGGSGAGPVTTPVTRTTARNGTNSSFGSSSAVGGNYGNNVDVNGAVGGAAVNGFGKGGNASTSNSSSNHATAGSAGVTSNITGNNLNYGGGGGGGGWNADNLGGTGGAGGGGNGSGSNLSVPTNGTANLGGGGGGSRQNNQIAANGGSGVVIIAYITTAPTILTQPLSDTTTAGIVETFTITTSAAPTPLTKSVQWQFTTDTATGVTGWTNVSSGTGGTTDTFTTVALTTSMNKYRFRAIVTFSDTSTLSVQETSTVAILTINPAITITSETSTITRKYGDTQTVRTLVYSGGTTSTGAVGTTTSHTVRGSFGTQASGRIVLDTSTTTTVFRVDTGTVVGSYVETITVTDAKGATATYTQRVVVNPADTLTVQADTLTAMTYSPSGLVISPATTLTGLVSGDTKDSLTFTYSSKNVTCANGGTCAVGNTGPGGGIVFYSVSGKYLEAAPASWFGTATDTRTVWGCSGSTYSIAYATAIGTGKANTDQIVSNCGNPTSNVAAKIARAYTGGGKSDWSLPSRDELIELCKYARTQTTGNVSTSCTTAGTLNAGVLKGFGNADGDSQYWSSSDASTNNAYTVWLSGSVSGGFGGKTVDRYIRPVRYFTSDLYAANSCAAGGSCSLGDIGPSGGVVFYVSSSGSINSASNISEGGTYLEAAPSPFSATTYKWCEGSSNPYTTLLGASGTAIGTGAANTATALASCTGGAIYQAANLTSGGYSDWFLPSSNELSQMYAWRNSIGLSSSALYWGSTENANWIAASLVMSNGGIGSQNKGQATTYWPIRAFSQVLPTLQSYGPITTPPTNAGTYTVTPSNLTLIGGISTSNYTFINYLSSEFIINKARQDTLTVGSVLGVYETGTATMQITTLGGSDTGTVTYAVASGGTATGCSVLSNLLTVTSVGTCRLVATKAATLNYLIAYSDTATITFTRFIPRAVQVQLYPSMIPLNQGNALETTTVTSSTLTISAVTRTGAGAYTITGTGFTNIELVSIGGAALTGSNYTRVSSTTLTLSGVSSFVGPLLIRLADGQESVLFQFDWS